MADSEEDDVDAGEGRESPTPQSAAKDQESSTNHLSSSQGLKQPFPVNILLDTGSLGDGNVVYTHIT